MLQRALCIVVASVAIVAPASAHHSMAFVDHTKMIALEGVVTEVKWRNPHMFIEVAVPTEDGKTETWGFEGSGTASTVASGISREILKVGNKVKIIAHRSKDPSKHLGLFMGMEVNGKYYARGGGTNIRGADEGK